MLRGGIIILVLCLFFGQLKAQTSTSSNGDFQTSGNWTSGVPSSSTDATISHNMTLSASISINGGDWNVSGSVIDAIGGNVALLDVDGSSSNYGILTVDGNVTFEGAMTVKSYGEVIIKSGDTLRVGDASKFKNNSVVLIESGGVMIVSGGLTNNKFNDSVIVNGSLIVNGTLTLLDSSKITGTGSITANEIVSAGVAELFGAIGNRADCNNGCSASNANGVKGQFYVSTSGNDVNDGLSLSSAKATIQDVFDNYDLNHNSIINVSSGTYIEYDIEPGANDEGFTINGNGIDQTILNGNDKGRIFYFSNANHDSITISNLNIIGGHENSSTGGGFRTSLNAHTGLNFTSVKFDDNTVGGSRSGAAVYLGEHTQITFDNCTFSNNVGGKGGAIFVNEDVSSTATVNINNSTFLNNEATSGSYGGGAIYQGYGASITIDSSTFTGNHGDATSNSMFYGGGAIFVYSDGYNTSTVISNSTFQSNYVNGSKSSGGAILLYDDSRLTLNNCVFNRNYTTTDGYGGAIYSRNNAVIESVNSSFRSSSATKGGAIYSAGDSLILSSSFFDLDSAKYSGTDNSGLSGGAIYLERGVATIDSVVIDSCVTSATSNSDADGAGLAIQSGIVTITKSTFSKNVSNDDGAAISSVAGTLTLSNSILYSNNAQDRGGAIYFGGSGSVTNCTVYGNSSADASQTSADGIECAAAQTITILNSIIYGNGDNDIREGDGSDGTINVSYSCYQSYSGGGTLSNNISSSPLFYDAGNSDFNIYYSSPCKDAGTNTGAPAKDIVGNNRPFNVTTDIGAYENQCNANTTWDGSESNDLTDANNWTNGIPCGGGVVITSDGTAPLLNGTSIVVSDLTINSGATLTVSSSDPNVFLTIGGDITVNGTINHTGSTPIYLSGASKSINVGGSANQSNAKYSISSGGSYTLLDNANIGGLTISSSAAFSLTDSKQIDVDGDLVINGTFNGGLTSAIKINGDITNTGSFNSSTSTLTLDGSSLQNINLNFVEGSRIDTLLNEGFENGGARPSGWTESYAQGTVDWQFATGGRSGSNPSTAHSGTYNARFNEDVASNNSTWLISPELDFTTHNTNAQLEFWLAQTSWGSKLDTVGVYYKTSAAGSWVFIQNYTTAVADWTKQTISLPNVNGTYYIGFKAYANYARSVVIDDVIVSAELPANTYNPINAAYKLNVNNNSGIQLSSNLGIAEQLSLTYGIITTTADDTVMIMNTSPGSLVGYSEVSYINGYLKRFIAENTMTYAFPMGVGTGTNDYYLTELTNDNMVGVNYIEAHFVSGPPPGYSQGVFESEGLQVPTGGGVTGFTLDEISTDGYLRLDPNQQPTGGSYDLKIYTNNFNTGSWNSDKVVIVKRPSGSTNASDWVIAGDLLTDGQPGRGPSDGYVIVNNVTSFSEIVPGGDFGAPLPIELTDFSAYYDEYEQIVRLDWVTASELNNSHFEVLRTVDGSNFEFVGRVNGQGDSFVDQYYDFEQHKPGYGEYYYRLRQYDFNGDFSESDDVLVRVGEVLNSKAPLYYSDGVVIMRTQGRVEELKIYNEIGIDVTNQVFIQYSEEEIQLSSDDLFGIYYFYVRTNFGEQSGKLMF